MNFSPPSTTRSIVLLISILLALVGMGNLVDAGDSPDQVAARELLRPTVYPDAQFGMAVRSVRSSRRKIVVVTTGTRFEIMLAQSRIVASQLLGRKRKCITVQLPAQSLEDAKVLSHTTGAVVLGSARARLRINGDSLLMFESETEGPLKVGTHFTPEYDISLGDNRLMLDNYGGAGVYLIGGRIPSRPQAPSPEGAIGSPLGQPRMTATANWGRMAIRIEPRQVLWVSICPPRPFDWETSFRDRWFGCGCVTKDHYPSDAGLRQHIVDLGIGSIYSLTPGGNLWAAWQRAYDPRQGMDELRRVIRTIQRLGLKAVVYTSPYYFTKGTPHVRFSNAPDELPRTGSPWGTGENLSLFLPEVRKVVEQYGVDGLYYDGLYCDSLVQSYKVMRETRQILGDHRVLCVHSTYGPPGNNRDIYCPALDAYADFQYRGEDKKDLAQNITYLRYVVSGYNISNCIGMPCHNMVAPAELNIAFIDAILDFNTRLFPQGEIPWDRIQTYYWPQLNRHLQRRVDRVMAERNARIQPPQTATDE